MSDLSFEMWSLINRVQELSNAVGWLRRENAQAKAIIDRLLSAEEAGDDLTLARKIASEFLVGAQEEIPQ